MNNNTNDGESEMARDPDRDAQMRVEAALAQAKKDADNTLAHVIDKKEDAIDMLWNRLRKALIELRQIKNWVRAQRIADGEAIKKLDAELAQAKKRSESPECDLWDVIDERDRLRVELARARKLLTPAPNREAELKVIEAAKEALARWMPLSMDDRAAFKILGEATRALASLAQSEMNGKSVRDTLYFCPHKKPLSDGCRDCAKSENKG